MSQTAMTKADKKAKKNEARDTIVVIAESGRAVAKPGTSSWAGMTAGTRRAQAAMAAATWRTTTPGGRKR